MRRIVLCLVSGILVLLFVSANAFGHTPILLVEDNEDGTVFVEGAFSDGSTAAGQILRVEDADGKVLWEGKFDEDGCGTVNKPDVPYWIVMDAGAGHVKKMKGPGKSQEAAPETEAQEATAAQNTQAEPAPPATTTVKVPEAESSPAPAAVSPTYVPDWAPGVTTPSPQANTAAMTLVTGQLNVIVTVSVLLLAVVCLYIGFRIGRSSGR